MKKVILIVEDKSEEQVLAKNAVTDSGYGVILCGNLFDAKQIINQYGNKLAGIITDLHFPESKGDNNHEKPAGLAVITSALKARVAVSVCSDIDNHYSEYVKDIIIYLSKDAVGEIIPLTVDAKNWKKAFSNLKLIIGG